jgi:geranylgeranyl reductase family protein
MQPGTATRDSYDVIIIGAGPAGTSAAYHLAGAGLRVLIIEKSIFPRRKVCGGGLTHRAYRKLPFNIQPVVQREVTWGFVSTAGRPIAAVHGDGPISYLVERASFDAYLLEKALEKGASCHFGERFQHSDDQGNVFTVRTDRENYLCRYLVGADGVHSQVARQNGLITNRATSLAYEARLRLPQGEQQKFAETITFDFGTLLFGYGWIFPKNDHLNVGVFRSWPGRKTNKKHLLRFIDQHPALHLSDLIDIRAHPIPMGGEERSIHKNNLLLVGDAANLADPWLGEGLYDALRSGRIAAEVIIQHASGGCENLSAYTEIVNQTLIKAMQYAQRLSLLVHCFPILNTRLLQWSPTLQGMIINLLRGDRTHEQVWCEIKNHFPRLLMEILQGK